MLHVTHKKFALYVGNDVTVGHSAILHGCTIHDKVLIGMGAKVLDACVVNSHTIIAAGAVLPEGAIAPAGVLMAGVPAKVVRELRAEEYDRFEASARNYVEYAERYRQSQILDQLNVTHEENR
jgi:carbonic anhydrase/acetyltransferase-like protein (isoleucine patch superfamily)